MIFAPHYLTTSFPNICSVWDYVPHISYLCRMRGGPVDVGSDQDGEDRVDPSPRDHQITTCTKSDLSERTYLSFGDAWSHKEHPIFIGRMTRDSSRIHDCEDLHQRISSDNRDSMSLWLTVETRGRFEMHRSSSDERWLTVDRAIGTAQTYLDLHLMADLHRGMIAIFVDRTAGSGLSSRSRSDGLEGARKNSTITV